MADLNRFTPEELKVLHRELDFSHGVVSVRLPRSWWEYLWPGTWVSGLARSLQDLYSR